LPCAAASWAAFNTVRQASAVASGTSVARFIATATFALRACFCGSLAFGSRYAATTAS
jgi:hypothetical protein